MSDDSMRPVTGFTNKPATGRGRSNRDWWPNQVNLRVLHQHSPLSNPMGGRVQLRPGIQKLDLAAVKKDLRAVMTDSQDCYPEDFGHYGAPVHPHGMAQRRLVPHWRRSRGYPALIREDFIL